MRKFVAIWIDTTGPDAGVYQVINDGDTAHFPTIHAAEAGLLAMTQGDREGVGFVSWFDAGETFPLFIFAEALRVEDLSEEQRQIVTDSQNHGAGGQEPV